MPFMNFDLEDGLPPIGFTLKPDQADRFMDFLAECQQAKEELAAMTAANGQAVPEGWKLVPLEADDDMVSAACEAANLFRVDAMRAIEAAIAAAAQGEKK